MGKVTGKERLDDVGPDCNISMGVLIPHSPLHVPPQKLLSHCQGYQVDKGGNCWIYKVNSLAAPRLFESMARRGRGGEDHKAIHMVLCLNNGKRVMVGVDNVLVRVWDIGSAYAHS